MRILWLYKYIEYYNFDHFLHMSFVQAMKGNPDATIFAYGPGLIDAYPDVTPIPYSPTLSLEKLHEQLAFDIVVVNTKSRCFDYYNPKVKRAEGCWLPPDFNAWKKTKKVVIEEDYHYETDDLWYQEVGINLILQRHYSQVLRQEKVPMKWLPFSVDTNTFKDSGYSRIQKIAFVGNSADEAYLYRRTATNKLFDVDLCANYTGSIKVDGYYIDVLQRYLGYISCGSTYEITAAKNFEIMASGGVLFTNSFLGIEKLFPENAYVSYSNNCSDVVEKGKRILFDDAYRTNIVLASKQCIKEKHTHEIRVKEMINLFKEIQ
jgi:hypothetical protein